MRQKRGAEDDVRLTVRLPKEIHAAISEEAARQNRTFNAQLVHILEAAWSGTIDSVLARRPRT